MSVDIRNNDRRRYLNELQAREKEIAAGLLKSSQPDSPKGLQENEKRMRREIANSNERRRMQCINAGFSNLRALIPQLEGEKLSKAAILQHATEYITSMEKDKARLQVQLDQTKRMLSELGQDRVVTDTCVSSSPPPSKRKKRDTESSDEGVGSLSDASDEGGLDVQHENVTLRHQLEIERQRCATLEERICVLEDKLLAVMQAQGCQSGSLHDVHPVSHDHLQIQLQQTLYNTRQTLVPSPRGKSFQPPRPLSPTPERALAVETSMPLDVTVQRSETESLRFCAFSGDHMSSALKLEIVPVRETSTPSGLVSSAEVATATTTTPTISTTADQPTNHHHHNYCHRDHPRRRHRLQAQLEQQRVQEEEEEQHRRQQEQHEMAVAAAALYRPKHNTQNLENLVEAIRQIEGDRILCGERKLCEDKLSVYDQHHRTIPTAEKRGRKNSSVSDQDEFKSESSGRDSPPLNYHHHHQQQLHYQQQQIIITSHPETSSPSSSPSATVSQKNSISNSGMNFCEKYPIASHLLHSPLQLSFYRPGVIVHKQ